MRSLPTFRQFCRVRATSNPALPIFDVKFYPLTFADNDAVFAFVQGNSVTVCRCDPSRKDGVLEVVRSFQDEDPSMVYNSLVWLQSKGTHEPLLCVAGNQQKINLINFISGKCYTLSGHGGEIHQLATFECAPWLVASSSEDRTIRVWDVSRMEEGIYPCIMQCAGQGHSSGVLSIAAHSSGRAIISGGFDTRLNLWILPSISSISNEREEFHTVHSPHFQTTEVHAEYVDCVAFHQNLVISRSSHENRILIWLIHNFDPPAGEFAASHIESSSPAVDQYFSKLPPAVQRTRQRLHHRTISAFTTPDEVAKFSVLVSLAAPESEEYWMRFDLWAQPDHRPVLAFGTKGARCLFWDLQSLEDLLPGPDERDRDQDGGSAPIPIKRKRGRQPAINLIDNLPTANNDQQGTMLVFTAPVIDSEPASQTQFPSLGDPLVPILAHKTVNLSTVAHSVGRNVHWLQAAWSPSGEWCVFAGNNGNLVIFGRWSVDIDESRKRGAAHLDTVADDN